MNEHFNKLSPAEAERLALLIEECAELQQAACKILRHGYGSKDPTDAWHRGNKSDLEKEMGDVQAAMDIMLYNADVDGPCVTSHRYKKLRTVGRWLHHNENGVEVGAEIIHGDQQ